jgi:signal transduction histidine kinase/FixJ family two-component response regulator
MSRLSTRLLVWFLVIALLPLLIGALLVTTLAERAARRDVYNALTIAADNQVIKIEQYIQERLRVVTTIARAPNVVGTFRRLSSASGDNLTQRLVIGTVMAFLEDVARRTGFTDVYLIDNEGTILAALRQSSVGINIRDPRAGYLELSRVVTTARTLSLAEVSEYVLSPLTNEPVAYVASPVYENGVLTGVLAFQLDNAELYHVVTDRTGLGETGETVVGVQADDGVTIAAPLRFDPQAAFQRTIPDGASVLTPLQRAINGDEGSGEALDYREQMVASVWRYVPSLQWGLVVKQDVAEAFAFLNQQRSNLLLVVLLTLALVTVAAFLVSRWITAPLVTMSSVVRRFADGDMNARIQLAPQQQQSDDERYYLAAVFNQMAHQIADQVNFLETRIQERTRQIAEYAESMNIARQDAETARASAERANQAKTVFLTSMSHELRTPLNAILGFAQVMERDARLSPKHQEHVGIILRSGEHLLSLINDVLEMSKIEAGQMTLNDSVFDLPELLRGIETMMQVRASAKRLQLMFELDEELPRYIRTDEAKLRQILINLVGNGIKFTAEGGVAVRAARLADADAPSLIFEIEDTGHGIAPEEIGRLFQPFIQTESGRQTQEGTGLGLALSRQFAQLMGGDISVQSAIGHGTTFTLTLTFTDASALDLPAQPTTRRVRHIDPADTRDYRILVVDDKWENRHLMSTWLTNVGFAVREAANGEEAVEMFEAWEPQLIWMDMRMPVLNGYEATKRIKASVKGSATIIIALTASALDSERTTVMSAGCDDFVRKPTRESIIMDKMEQHLGVRFLYEDESPAASAADFHLTPARFAQLPADWRDRFRDAADRLDIEVCQGLAAELRPAEPQIAAQLEGWIANFRFDQIQALFASQETR